MMSIQTVTVEKINMAVLVELSAPNSDSQFSDPTSQRPLNSISIIGAGLAGLAAAIGLRKANYAVTVYERNPELQEVCSHG